jgi:hypothetical protein
MFLILALYFCSGEEDEDTPIDATARTSTSRTLVVSESRPDGDETSPPQQNIEQPPPAESPRASSPKRARVEPSKEPIQFPGNSSTPSLDDVSSEPFNASISPLCFAKCCRFYIGYIDFLSPLVISSAFNEGIYSSRYSIRRVP